MPKNKHLTNAERLQIEKWLKEKATIKQIAGWLEKDKSTISREIRKRAMQSYKYVPYQSHNRCAKKIECEKHHLCADKPNCIKRCSSCILCNDLCNDFEEQICYKLYDPPYVCNGCPEERRCPLQKRYYLHQPAHEAYREMLIESRVGANITEEELLTLDEIVSPLIQRGQSIHHIVSNNPDQFNISEKSIYRYVDGGLLKARNLDMPRVCRIRPRKQKPVEHKVDNGCRIGRTYADFMDFLEENPCPVVEMDSVIGRIGGKVLLTMMFKSCDFMLAFIRPRNTSQSVIDIFNELYLMIGAQTFRTLFPLILTDNGSEFSNPAALEFDTQGNRRTRIYYCDPYASFQKPSIELNHEFIRKILPKGKSFDELTQEKTNLMMSHINSYSREKLGDKSPFDVFTFLYGNEIPERLGFLKIPPNDILLKPSLLK